MEVHSKSGHRSLSAHELRFSQVFTKGSLLCIPQDIPAVHHPSIVTAKLSVGGVGLLAFAKDYRRYT